MIIKIYDNYEEKWLEEKFEEYFDAEAYVTNELGDADLDRYSIYELLGGS